MQEHNKTIIFHENCVPDFFFFFLTFKRDWFPHPPSFIIEKIKPVLSYFLFAICIYLCAPHILQANYYPGDLLEGGFKPYWMLIILFSLTILGVELFFPLWSFLLETGVVFSYSMLLFFLFLKGFFSLNCYAIAMYLVSIIAIFVHPFYFINLCWILLNCLQDLFLLDCYGSCF